MSAVLHALGLMAVIALVAMAAAIVWAEVLHGRADRRYAEELRECGRVAGERAARVRADCAKSRSLADYGFDLAERQLAQAGPRRAMPSREQVVAAAGDGCHDWLGVPDAQRALEVALLESEFRHEARPPVAADTDPDGTAHRW